MNTSCLKLAAVALFLTTILVTGVHGALIISLDNTPTVHHYAQISYQPLEHVTRTIPGLPFSESGVYAYNNRVGTVKATADYDFFTTEDSAKFRIDFDLWSKSWEWAGSSARIENDYSMLDRFLIHNTSGMDIQYSVSGELRMTSGYQWGSIATSFRASDYSYYFNLAANDRYMYGGEVLSFTDTGILPAGQVGALWYQVYSTHHTPFGHLDSTAEGFIDLEFTPVASPIPEPSTLAIWSLLGLCGFAFGWRRRRRAA